MNYRFHLIELKGHSYFDGIDWEEVAQRRSEPPFEPTEMEAQINYNETSAPLDIDGLMRERNTFYGEKDHSVDMNLIENSFRNYTFVAPEHQN